MTDPYLYANFHAAGLSGAREPGAVVVFTGAQLIAMR
jgi:hypothetical protein